MAASIARNVLRTSKIFYTHARFSQARPRACLVGNLQRHVPGCLSGVIGCTRHFSSQQQNDPDELYKFLEVEVKGHDKAVLASYEKFVTAVSQELDLQLLEIETPPKDILRRTLLKSVHIYKKHRVQYEIMTHFKVFKFQHMTGSTASTFLEYIQRNLPEGVAMKVTKHRLERIPEHIKPPHTEVQGTL